MNTTQSQNNPMAHVKLSEFVTKTAQNFGIPVAVVWADGQGSLRLSRRNEHRESVAC